MTRLATHRSDYYEAVPSLRAAPSVPDVPVAETLEGLSPSLAALHRHVAGYREIASHGTTTSAQTFGVLDLSCLSRYFSPPRLESLDLELRDLVERDAPRGISTPSADAIAGAMRILETIEQVGLAPLPEHVTYDAGGGIAFLFYGNQTLPSGARSRHVVLTSGNDGTITFVGEDRANGTVAPKEIPPGEAQLRSALDEIAAFCLEG